MTLDLGVFKDLGYAVVGGGSGSGTVSYHLIHGLNTAKVLEVYDLYQAAFRRIPDESGLRYYASLVDHHHTSLNKVALEFIHSSEFAQKYGVNPSNATYVNELYQNLLGSSAGSERRRLFPLELA